MGSAVAHIWAVRPPIVAQCDPHPSHSATLLYRTYKDHPGCHNPPEAGEEMPGRFELGVARRNGMIEDVLEKITAAAQETKRLSSLPVYTA